MIFYIRHTNQTEYVMRWLYYNVWHLIRKPDLHFYKVHALHYDRFSMIICVAHRIVVENISFKKIWLYNAKMNKFRTTNFNVLVFISLEPRYSCLLNSPLYCILFKNFFFSFLAHIPLFLYPFLHTVSKTRPFEYLRLTSLGVIGALVKVRPSVVNLP